MGRETHHPLIFDAGAHRRRYAAAVAAEYRPAVAAIVEQSVEEVGDGIQLVRRRWPELWTRICALARDSDELPGAMMAAAIEAGLEVFEGKGGQCSTR